jgi:hypothetical protein
MLEFHLGHEFLFSKVMCGLNRDGLPIGLQIVGVLLFNVNSTEVQRGLHTPALFRT